MKYDRILNIEELLKKKSFFLFGPRSTGKTFLINEKLKNSALILNLLRSELFLRLSNSPSELEDIILADNRKHTLIVIDEIQRIPELLFEVHRLLEKQDLRFLLTGSSARKLKKGNADLLAGRAWTANLFPLCYREIPNFDLDQYLRYGGLPHVYGSQYPQEELFSYVDTYLKEEIRAEGLIRKLQPFTRFLKVAALSCGELINFTEIANDSAVGASTVREYYSVLEDTLVGFILEPWIRSMKRKAIQTAKFYLFDTGVTHTLSGTKELDRNSNLYGKSFEQFIGMELRAYLSYRRIMDPLTFWRSTHGFEVDFLIGEHTGIEVKAAKRISQQDLKGLKALSEETVFKNLYLVSQDKITQKKDNILAIHWEDFIKKLWSDEII